MSQQSADGGTHKKRTDRRQRLLAREKGQVSLNANAPVRIALVFPNQYGVGMASVGFQTVYRLLNAHEGVCCERAFAPQSDRETVCTFETGTPLSQCDVIAFTVAFELDMPNVLRVLLQSNVRPLRDQRSGKDPLIIMGGIVAGLNPSPLLSFMDGLLAGEGEGLFYALCDLFYQAKMKRQKRDWLRRELADLPGFYVPGITQTVRRRVVENLEETEAYTPIITPESHFKNMFVVEVGRGCRRGCFFCAAQHVYEPFRLRSKNAILKTIAAHNPGSSRIGLESAGLSDYPNLNELVDALVQGGYQVSFSSIRADCVTPELIQQVEKSGVRSFTVAPEAGSPQLRARIGKGISQQRLLETVQMVAASSIKILKLYFLIGLPAETRQDIEAMIHLIQEMSAIFSKLGKNRQIRVSVNAFIPKPFTEFQWAALEPAEKLNEKRRMIRAAVQSMANVTLNSKSTRLEQLQGLLALGNEQTGLALLHHLQTQGAWRQSLREFNIHPETVLSPKSYNTKLPWAFIEEPFRSEILWKRYEQACKL